MTAAHRPTRRTVLILAAATCSLPDARAGASDFGPAIDKAGSQRMLSQRIVKAYCQLGLKVTPEDSRRQLDAALRRFGAQLRELQRDAPTTAIRQGLVDVDRHWQPFRTLAGSAVSRDGARRLAELGEPLLAAAHVVVLQLQQAAGTPQARLVNTSGRQRMLSQRLAKAYLLRAWGVDAPQVTDQLDSAAHEFAGALTALREAPENTPEIGAELDAVALQWEWFAGAIALQGSQSYALVVADASESILERMDRITGLYARLPAR